MTLGLASRIERVSAKIAASTGGPHGNQTIVQTIEPSVGAIETEQATEDQIGEFPVPDAFEQCLREIGMSQIDWRLGLCLFMGLFTMTALEPQVELILFNAQATGIIPVGLRGAAGVIAGHTMFRLSIG